QPERARDPPDVGGAGQVAEPALALVELESRAVEVEADERLDPEADLRQAGEKRNAAGPEARERQQPDGQGDRDRHEDQDGREHGYRTATKTTAMTARLDAIASA